MLTEPWLISRLDDEAVIAPGEKGKVNIFQCNIILLQSHIKMHQKFKE
jgi:hypothetical protein